jgi:hypothetical protein
MFTDLNNVLSQPVITENEKLTRFDSLSSIVSIIVNFFIATGFSLSLIGIAYAFVQFIMSQGDPKVEKVARDALTFSIVAMFISLLAVALKTILFRAAGVTSENLLNDSPGI